MRYPTLSLILLAALVLPACAGSPTPVERHWGEAQRNASEAQISAAKGADRPLDGQGAEAAYGNYGKSLSTRGAQEPSSPAFAIAGDD